jgi:peptidoglycan/LPS O-acetylase OafA/YrhL
VVEHALFLRNFQAVRIEFMPEAWSLAVEEWFYVIFPALLWIGYRRWPGRFETVFGVTAAALFFVSLGCRIHGAGLPGSNWVMGQRCAVFYRFDALMTGVIAAWIAHTRPSAWARLTGVCALAGVVTLGVGYGGIWNWTDPSLPLAADGFYAKTFRFNVISFGVALLLPMASGWRPRRETLIHSAIRKVALWSYAMYLVNWPLFQILMTPTFARLHSSWWSEHLFFAFKQALLIAVSAAFYGFYELPCTRIRERLPGWLGLARPGQAPNRAPA